MKTHNEQLCDLAKELEKLIPISYTAVGGPKIFMEKAADFARLCLDQYGLSEKLKSSIRMQEQGNFLRAVRTIETVGNRYHSGMDTDFKHALAVVLKTLETADEKTFTIRNLNNLITLLSETQRKLLDTIWSHFVQTGKPYPFRSIPAAIGKTSPAEILSGLKESLIETSNEGSRALQITIYGALQTGNGPVLALRLIQLLELVKELYEQDHYIKIIDCTMVRQKLNLSDAECDLLCMLLRIKLPFGLPFYLSSHREICKDWTITVTDDVTNLYLCEDISTYFDELLCADFAQQQQWHNHTAIPIPNLAAETVLSTQPSHPPPHIDEGRLADIRSLKNPNFDCTRLICLCEELNACAAGRNAHAVIMLTRAILDHIPPVFGHDTFAQVAANYKANGTSFKKSAERLDKHSRNVADRYLHSKIRDKESLPTMSEVNFVSEIDSVLSEVIRILK